MKPLPDKEVLKCLVAWANETPNVRAVLLTSSRASEHRIPDRFSDYDVELYARDPAALAGDAGWLAQFGSVLVTFEEHDGAWYTLLVQYDDTTKIDFQLGPTDDLRKLGAGSQLPDHLDIGYRVLVDKDRLAADLPRPTYSAYGVPRPTEEALQRLVNEFWWDATYVAKHVWREDLLPAKYSLDHMLKHTHLRQMLEWRIAMDKEWQWTPGAYGKGLQQQLDPETWRELAATYVGGTREAQWDGLFATAALFRRIARTVAEQLRYTYPAALDSRVTAYLERVRALPAGLRRGDTNETI